MQCNFTNHFTACFYKEHSDGQFKEGNMENPQCITDKIDFLDVLYSNNDFQLYSNPDIKLNYIYS